MPHTKLAELALNVQGLIAPIIGQIKAAVQLELQGKLQELIDKFKLECPPPEELAIISKQIDSLEGVLNSFDNRISKFTPIPGQLDAPIGTAEAGVEVLSHLALPVGAPIGVGLPSGILNTFSNIIGFTQKAISTLKREQQGVEGLLSTVAGITAPVKAQLATLKNLLQGCIESGELNKDLESNIQPQDGDTTDEYKGYTLKIIPEPTTDPRVNIARRQAVALDRQGIIRLRGDYSYASRAQILLDELKFRIDNELP